MKVELIFSISIWTTITFSASNCAREVQFLTSHFLRIREHFKNLKLQVTQEKSSDYHNNTKISFSSRNTWFSEKKPSNGKWTTTIRDDQWAFIFQFSSRRAETADAMRLTTILCQAPCAWDLLTHSPHSPWCAFRHDDPHSHTWTHIITNVSKCEIIFENNVNRYGSF